MLSVLGVRFPRFNLDDMYLFLWEYFFFFFWFSIVRILGLALMGFFCACDVDLFGLCLCGWWKSRQRLRESCCWFPCWLKMRFVVDLGELFFFLFLTDLFFPFSELCFTCVLMVGLDWLFATFLTGLHFLNRVLGEI